MESCDVAVIGAGAAGLMAAIFAARSGARVVALDSAPRIGAKIIISGGGRCNVTHDVVRAENFNGNRNQIARVLRTFDVPETVEFFASLGVRLKREDTGKLFPVSDQARDVVNALLRACADAGVSVRTSCRVASLDMSGSPILTMAPDPSLTLGTRRLIIAAGGKSVPKTGSDGSGYALAQSIGHTVTKTFPALVPLVVEKGHWITALSGLSADVELRVKSDSGRILHRERGSMLFTHFGLSGPVVLDISRHWIASQPATLSVSFRPDDTFDSLESQILDWKGSLSGFMRRLLPDRLVPILAKDVPVARLTREERRTAIHSALDLTLPVIADRGFDYAEVTAGGVPLSEVNVSTMASRLRPDVYLCGEILDVDGKIGGYNFQWAWSSGRLAGLSAAG